MLRKTLQFFFLVTVILLVSQIFYQSPSFESFNQQWIDKYTRDNGLLGIIQYLSASVLLLSIGLPRQLVAFMGGYAFGVVEGIFYSTVAATLSCAIVMMFARYFARPMVTHYFDARVNTIDTFLLRSPFLKTITIRLLPLGNNLVTNALAGVTKISFKSFILGSAIGYIPQMAIFALMGKGLLVNSVLKISLSVLLFVISSLLSAYLFKIYRHEQAQLNEPVCSKQLTR